MGENTDKIKGRAKQAAGDLTDDEELRAEGEADEAAGKAKGMVNKAADAVQDGVEKVKDKLN